MKKAYQVPGLLANIFIEKYVDHLPLYRQIERYKREGLTSLHRASLTGSVPVVIGLDRHLIVCNKNIKLRLPSSR
ncbi:MAG: transposase [Bacteroidetes bacterium]|nr:transposase [Bacteroidota bacterium]